MCFFESDVKSKVQFSACAVRVVATSYKQKSKHIHPSVCALQQSQGCQNTRHNITGAQISGTKLSSTRIHNLSEQNKSVHQKR
jgi:hypothetical protein